MTEPSAAIVGIYEYPDRVIPDRTVLQVKAHCASKALADAGLAWADVDGLYDVGEAGGSIPLLAVAEYLGVHPKMVSSTSTGGSSYEVLAAQAARDIERGLIQVALVSYSSRPRSEGAGRVGTPPKAGVPHNHMEDVWGNSLIGQYGLAARRHMYEFGTTSEQLAEIAVVTRKHALRNPEAVAALEAIGMKNRGLITIEDVINSRMIADPLHLLECCMVSDGGGAIVIASRNVVKGTAKPPAWILGSGVAFGYMENDGDIVFSAAVDSGRRAFEEAGIAPEEIDIAMSYDSFTYTVLTALEDLGFCKKGEGGEFVSGGRLAFNSGLRPSLNTDGGGLSSNHPGMRGIFLLIEATRQLRRESTSQVDGARLAVCHGNGGWLSGRHCGATVVLAA